MRAGFAVWAPVLLPLLSGGCFDRPLVWQGGAPSHTELVEFQNVYWIRPSGPVHSGYFMRYRRREVGRDNYWIEVYNPLHQQIGVIDDGGDTYRWEREGGRWAPIGSYPFEAAVAAVFSVPPAEIEFRPVVTKEGGRRR